MTQTQYHQSKEKKSNSLSTLHTEKWFIIEIIFVSFRWKGEKRRLKNIHQLAGRGKRKWHVEVGTIREQYLFPPSPTAAYLPLLPLHFLHIFFLDAREQGTYSLIPTHAYESQLEKRIVIERKREREVMVSIIDEKSQTAKIEINVITRCLATF